jgi:hypothetical protein
VVEFFDTNTPLAACRKNTHNELYYVGPTEKEQFIGYLNQRLPDKRLQGHRTSKDQSTNHLCKKSDRFSARIP